MIYEYKCNTCDHRFEVLLSFPRALGRNHRKFPKARCPLCKSVARKVISYPNVVFSGPGFYVTDKGTK